MQQRPTIEGVELEDLTPEQRAEHERIVQWAHEQGQRALESLPSTPEQLEAFLQRIEEKEAAWSTRRGRGHDT
jgi:hypothetical protein